MLAVTTDTFANIKLLDNDSNNIYDVVDNTNLLAISEFYKDTVSTGENFIPIRQEPIDPRAVSLKAQLDNLVLKINNKPNTLATIDEAFRVQILVEEILSNT